MKDTAPASGLEGCREWGGENPNPARACRVLGAGLLSQLETDNHGWVCGTQPICHNIWSFQEVTRPGRVTALLQATRATKARS